MAVLGTTMLSLADKMKREDPDSKIATIIELLSETNEIMQDAITMEGNLPTGHRTTVRTGLPSGTWRKLYGGVQREKSTTLQVDDTLGMLEAYSEVDKSLADLNGNTAAFRMSESMAFLEGLNQSFATAFIYGDTDVNPEQFMGLKERYDATSTDKTKSGFNIVLAGGAGAVNTSIWFVTWGENTCHLIFPKGSQVGISHTDKGQVTLDDNATPSPGRYEGYRDHFKWDVGLSLRDWRSCCRIANVDTTNMDANTVALEEFMVEAWYKMRSRPGRKVIYCNREVMVGLHKRAFGVSGAAGSTNTRLNIQEGIEGKPIVTFLGIPIREVEAIINTEATIS